MKDYSFDEYLKLIATAATDPPAPEEFMKRLDSTESNYKFCRAMMEHYRTLWYHGKSEQIALLLDLPTRALRRRYGGYSEDARRKIAATLWVRCAIAKDYVNLEQMFCRWAQTYATALIHEGLPQLRRVTNSLSDVMF